MSPGPRPSFAHERFSVISPESSGNRRARGLKEDNFTIKHGSRHHSYDPEKAPYPLSYDKEFIGMDLLDYAFMRSVARISTVDFRVPPTKVLELGCGPGHWVIDAAKEWSDCEFVGFDLVNIQPPANYLEPSISNRVTWVHGNFLTKRLPFDEDEFDYVRVKFIAKGVPENKWTSLYEEIHRVLCPGGVMEAMEEDIRFPTLPKWFTTPLRAHAKRSEMIHLPDGSSQPSSPIPSNSKHLEHDHALLESLYYSVFETRFVNTRPTAICPAYASAIFRHVRSVPVQLKLPPFAPPPPPIDAPQSPPPVPSIPLDIVTKPNEDAKTKLPPLSSSVPTVSTETIDSLSSDSDSQLIRTPLENDTGTNTPGPEKSPQPSPLAGLPTVNGPSPAPRTTSLPPCVSQVCGGGVSAPGIQPTLGTSPSRSPDTSPQSTPRQVPSPAHPNKSAFRLSKKASPSLQHLSEVEDKCDYDLSSMMANIDQLATCVSGETLMTHLHRMVMGVVACKESMWEVLKDRLRHKQYEKELRELGWEDEDGVEELKERKRFEKMLERYKEDMHHRVAHWRTMVKMGWEFPPPSQMSRPEALEEDRLRQAMIEAQKSATAEDLEAPLRTFRIIVGIKGID